MPYSCSRRSLEDLPRWSGFAHLEWLQQPLPTGTNTLAQLNWEYLSCPVRSNLASWSCKKIMKTNAKTNAGIWLVDSIKISTSHWLRAPLLSWISSRFGTVILKQLKAGVSRWAPLVAYVILERSLTIKQLGQWVTRWSQIARYVAIMGHSGYSNILLKRSGRESNSWPCG